MMTSWICQCNNNGNGNGGNGNGCKNNMNKDEYE